jgi:hypothetical protein
MRRKNAVKSSLKKLSVLQLKKNSFTLGLKMFGPGGLLPAFQYLILVV